MCVLTSRRIALSLFTAGAFLGVPLHAAGLNDTGQTLCYDGAGAIVSCTIAPAADDGRYGRDAAATAGALTKIGAGAAGFDFTKIANNGASLAVGAALGTAATDWACTRDNVSGLTWEVKTTGATDLRYSGHSYTWYNTNSAENGGNAGSAGVVNTCNGTLSSNQCNTQAFVAAINATALCGYSDWRLPTPRELRSIVNYGAGNPMDATYFLTTARPNFWSASTHARTPAYAWVVSFGVDDGGGDGHAHVKTNNDLARLVRGGLQSAPSLGACTAGNPNANVVGSTPSADFTDNGNGTVTHAKTGLMWKRCAEGLSGATCATGAATTVTWSNALAAAESSSFAGFTDWRLPNLKELHSIVETCGYDLAINQSIFPATPAPAFGSVFWSATSSASDPAKVWIFVFGGGGGVADTKTSLMHARLVRGGQSFDTFDAQADSTPTLTAPTSLTSKAISSSSIVLGWGDNSNNETGFRIEIKPGLCDSANPWSQIATVAANVITYTDTGLPASTAYSYRVRAYNADGDSTYSNCAFATTGLVGTPNSPTTLKARSVAAGQVNLAWADNSTDETSFRILRRIDAGSWVLLLTTAANAVSYADTTALGNSSTTTYSYRMRACNGAGCSPATTVAVVPFSPAAFAANAVSSSQINLTWTDTSANETGFRIQRKTGNCASVAPWSLLANKAANSASHGDTGLTSGTTYAYRVRSFKRSPAMPFARGFSLWTNCVSITTP